ncbi:MAG: hypothetical protein KAI91_03210 [Candidatus Omnitrophica bacterium]|nr:hypothetical protein [Candidatus Omnitrophota bacterium]MCK5393319.1 hypothetical protein [Candidatus Omnitrophota bacterium]
MPLNKRKENSIELEGDKEVLKEFDEIRRKPFDIQNIHEKIKKAEY